MRPGGTRADRAPGGPGQAGEGIEEGTVVAQDGQIGVRVAGFGSLAI